MILNKITTTIDKKLISEQTGFRPRNSCTNQALLLTQYVEDGFETEKITGCVFVVDTLVQHMTP